MKTQFKAAGLAFVACFCLVSMKASAYTRCTTQSNGYNFQDADLDFNSARSRTISDCTSSSATNNGQCRANVRCDGDNYIRPPWISCMTQSNGYQFSDGDLDLMTSVNNTINNCTSSSATANGSCRANVSCHGTDGSYYRPYVRCTTQSNGYRFEDGDLDVNVSASKVVNDCTSSSATNNGQCRANLQCDGGMNTYPGNYYRCTTASNGYQFADGGTDYYATIQQVVNDCTSSSATDNGQCRANARCENSAIGRFNQPLPPPGGLNMSNPLPLPGGSSLNPLPIPPGIPLR